jgi:matrixin
VIVRGSAGRIGPLLAALAVGLAVLGRLSWAEAFELLPTPPGQRPAMTLDLPVTPFATVGYGLQSFTSLAASALDIWNGQGIGIAPDHAFFSVIGAPAVGDACSRDQVNEVRFAATICGMAWGDVLGLTFIRSIDGKVVETDVLFNGAITWDAFPGPALRFRDGQQVRDFVRVALHEFGHAAGLDHPDEVGQRVAAIMNSTISATDRLQPDDVAGVHAVAWGPPCVAAGANPGTTQVAPFVSAFYQTALGRNPSTAEVDAWVEYLRDNPHLGGATVLVRTFFDGPEYRQRPVTPWLHVWLLHAAILGRAPSADELAVWVGNLLARFDPILPLFVNSAEFRGLVPSLRDPAPVMAAVTRLYQGALGRTPSAAEVSAWAAYLLATGDMTGVAERFFDSPEYLVAPRTLAEHSTRLYRALLARDASFDEVAAVVGALATQLTDIEDAFVRSSEFLARCAALFR